MTFEVIIWVDEWLLELQEKVNVGVKSRGNTEDDIMDELKGIAFQKTSLLNEAWWVFILTQPQDRINTFSNYSRRNCVVKMQISCGINKGLLLLHHRRKWLQ